MYVLPVFILSITFCINFLLKFCIMYFLFYGLELGLCILVSHSYNCQLAKYSNLLHSLSINECSYTRTYMLVIYFSTYL